MKNGSASEQFYCQAPSRGSRYEYEMNVLLTCAFLPLSTEDYSADVS